VQKISIWTTRKMHDFQGYFSRTFQDQSYFQDFPGPGIFKKKIQDFPGGVGTLNYDFTSHSTEIWPCYERSTSHITTELAHCSTNSCAGGRHNMPPHPANWPFIWPWKWCPFESQFNLSDMGYLCANFSLPRPLCSRLRPTYATDRKTSDAYHRLMTPSP